MVTDSSSDPTKPDKKKKHNITNVIWRFFHCAECLQEVPEGVSPREYAKLEVGFTEDSRIQVWCKRHERHVAFFDAEMPPLDECQCADCKTVK